MYDTLVKATADGAITFCQIDENGEFNWLSTKGRVEGGTIRADGVEITLDAQAMARYNAAVSNGDPAAHHVVVGEGTFDGNRAVLFPSRKHGLALCQIKPDTRQPGVGLDAFV